MVAERSTRTGRAFDASHPFADAINHHFTICHVSFLCALEFAQYCILNQAE
jgi:hypothetical protein